MPRISTVVPRSPRAGGAPAEGYGEARQLGEVGTIHSGRGGSLCTQVRLFREPQLSEPPYTDP